jgi:cytochrome c-type biogenesis protein CcmH/NrfG
LTSTQRFDSATLALLEAKKLAPALPAIDLNLGLAYYHQQEFAKAIPEFSQVLQSHADNYRARYLLGMSYFMEDEYQHALVTLEPLASAEQDNLDFLFLRHLLRKTEA